MDARSIESKAEDGGPVPRKARGGIQLGWTGLDMDIEG